MSADRDAARGGPVQPRRHVQERALARPRRPHDRGERPRRELDADPVERDDRPLSLAMDFAHVAKGDRGRGDGGCGDVFGQGFHELASSGRLHVATPLSPRGTGRAPARGRRRAALDGCCEERVNISAQPGAREPCRPRAHQASCAPASQRAHGASRRTLRVGLAAHHASTAAPTARLSQARPTTPPAAQRLQWVRQRTRTGGSHGRLSRTTGLARRRSPLARVSDGSGDRLVARPVRP